MTEKRGYTEITGPKGRALVRYVKELGDTIEGKEGDNSHPTSPILTKPLEQSMQPVKRINFEQSYQTAESTPAVPDQKPAETEVTTPSRTPDFAVMFQHKAPILLTELERNRDLNRQKAQQILTPVESECLDFAAVELSFEPVEVELPVTGAATSELIEAEPDWLQAAEFQLAMTEVETTIEPVAIRSNIAEATNLQPNIDLQPNTAEPAASQLPIAEPVAVQITLAEPVNVPPALSEPLQPVPVQPVNAPQVVKTSLPDISMLNLGKRSGLMPFTNDILEKASLLEETLASFGVKAQVTDFTQGPTITRFELQPAPGVKVSRIVGLADDIALALAATGVRIEAPIPGKAAVGIEVPNPEMTPVSLREVMESKVFSTARSKLAVILGKDIGGETVIADLTKMPHLLIAGSTGSGKSVCMNTLITSILYKARPNEVKFLMIDPKMVELSTYNGIPHLIAPVITDPKQATAALRWVVTEMENRYNLFAALGVKNLASYNDLQKTVGGHALPLVVVLIDELADLMMVASREVEEAICRLAQMARAAGIHLVIATQRPSVDVITGIIKANIPSRIAFAVSSQVDSRTILDVVGADKLLGKGDMLYSPIGAAKPVRVQGAFVSDQEVERVVEFWKGQSAPEYLEGVLRVDQGSGTASQCENEDELLPEATKLIIENGQASVSMLQRRFRIGYNRAARLIDLMQEKAFIGGFEGSKPREVLITKEEWQEIFG